MRVLIADNNAFYVKALHDYIAMFDGIEVVDSVMSYKQILEVIRKHSPEILIIEPAMLGDNKSEKIKQIRAQISQVKIIAMTLLPTENFAFILSQLDIDEVVGKSRIVIDLIPIIQRIRSC